MFGNIIGHVLQNKILKIKNNTLKYNSYYNIKYRLN